MLSYSIPWYSLNNKNLPLLIDTKSGMITIANIMLYKDTVGDNNITFIINATDFGNPTRLGLATITIYIFLIFF